MKNKRSPTLWLYFAVVVFSIMLATALILAAVAFILFHLGYFDTYQRTPLIPILVLLIMSVIIGTAVSMFVGSRILKPITRFSLAAKQVAKGDFSIRLTDAGRIEEIRDLTKDFNTMVHELSGIETLRNDFVVNVSHELKTPITAIEGYATLLQDKELSESEHDEYVKMILDSSRQLSNLCSNILKLSKLENQEIVLDRNYFRLDEQIRQAVLLLERKWSQKEIEFDIDLPNTLYYGNEELLKQVWINLLDNAIKFSKSKGTICIFMKLNEKTARIDISDNGCGMTEEVLHHLFEKFYQGNSSRHSDGNGLGLALVKRIMELCQGRITVKSEVDKGTTFTIYLPVV